MTRGLARLTGLATSLALALSFSAFGPATADTTVTRDSDAERYALKLLNCTRTGGWVQANGKCLGKYSGTYSAQRKRLRLHYRISNKVAYPWAKAITMADQCTHSLAGKPDLVQRFQRKGFMFYRYGENIGCGTSGDTRQLVLMTHRMMQAEKPYGGGHWKNMKNPAFKSVGIGVASDGNSTMVVYDFYGRLYN